MSLQRGGKNSLAPSMMYEQEAFDNFFCVFCQFWNLLLASCVAPSLFLLAVSYPQFDAAPWAKMWQPLLCRVMLDNFRIAAKVKSEDARPRACPGSTWLTEAHQVPNPAQQLRWVGMPLGDHGIHCSESMHEKLRFRYSHPILPNNIKHLSTNRMTPEADMYSTYHPGWNHDIKTILELKTCLLTCIKGQIEAL